jgi:hypothetical protein
MTDDAKIVRLGGRDWKPVVDSTIEHDYWLMGHIRRAGIDEVVIDEDETPDEFVLRFLRETINAGVVFILLGGALMPADKSAVDWTPQMAEDTAAFMKRLTDPQDKQTVHNQVVSLISGFFVQGLISLRTSPRSSLAETSPPENARSAVH